MKKLSIIFIILSFLFVNQVSACGCGPDIHKVSTTIDNVEYNSVADEFLFNTTPDSDSGHWTIQMDEEELGSVLTVEALTAKFKGVKMEVDYVGNLDTDDEIEIVSSRIIN